MHSVEEEMHPLQAENWILHPLLTLVLRLIEQTKTPNPPRWSEPRQVKEAKSQISESNEDFKNSVRGLQILRPEIQIWSTVWEIKLRKKVVWIVTAGLLSEIAHSQPQSRRSMLRNESQYQRKDGLVQVLVNKKILPSRSEKSKWIIILNRPKFQWLIENAITMITVHQIKANSWKSDKRHWLVRKITRS